MSLLNVKARNTTIFEPGSLAEARTWLAAFLADLGASKATQARALTLEEGGAVTFCKVPYWIDRF